MDDQKATCEICGKTYTGPKAANQLRGHAMAAHRTTKEQEPMAKPEATKRQTGSDFAETAESNVKDTLTPEEKQIADLAAAQDTSWHTITESDMEDYSLADNPMALPPPAQKAQDDRKYAFHWAEASHKRIHQLARLANPPYRWSIVNRSTMPELAPWVNDQMGCVTREGCVLLFKPWHHHAVVMQRKHEAANLHEQGSGINKGKNRITERDDDVSVFTGKKFKIGAGDVVQTIQGDDGQVYESPDDLAELVDASGA